MSVDIEDMYGVGTVPVYPVHYFHVDIGEDYMVARLRQDSTDKAAADVACPELDCFFHFKIFSKYKDAPNSHRLP